jgi:hypothetical protein
VGRRDASRTQHAHGRYDAGGTFVFTAKERLAALALTGVLLLTLRLLEHAGALDAAAGRVAGLAVGGATLFAAWIAIVGAAHPDPD